MHLHLMKGVMVVLGNAFALWLADQYVPGFALHATVFQIVVIALVLSLLNFFLKPLLVLLLGPVIIFTLGLGVLIVNAIIIKLLPILADHLDMLRGSISIETIPALILTTLIVSAINFVIHLAI